MSLLRAGVDMLPSCPAVSLKEKSPAQPPHPPARRSNHCRSPPPPKLHKQPCNDVSLRRLQIPPPSARTTEGGVEEKGIVLIRALIGAFQEILSICFHELIEKLAFSVFRLEILN